MSTPRALFAAAEEEPELGAPGRSENDAKWALEAEARIDAYDCVNIAAIPAAAVFEKIEKKYAP